MIPPTFDDIVAARKFISQYLPRTPLVRIPQISEALECDYYAKLENLQPTGAFKVRGGVNLVGRETSAQSGLTLITASTGNHGQSIAYGGRLFGARVIIYAPAENVNESKMQAMRDLGAEIRLHGRDFDEARLEMERVAGEAGYRYVHSANEAMLIAGVGTLGWRF
jgi:threonine dehydratase